MIPHSQRPIIGCLTYQKRANEQDLPVISLASSYIQAVRQAGGIPVLVPLLLEAQEMRAVLDRLDGILMPGGGDMEAHHYGGSYHATMYGIDPLRDEFEMNVVRYAVQEAKPVFAICRGVQVFNVALGGSLWEDIHSQMPAAIKHDYYPNLPRNLRAHPVDVLADSCLAHYLRSTHVEVNSLHHQGIRDLADGVQATAVAPDGLIEAIEVPGHPFALGVQWHPECMVDDDPAMLRLFEGLVKAAARRN